MPEPEPRKWRIATRLKEARAKTKPRISQAQIARQVAEAGQRHFTEGHASRLELGYLEATRGELVAIAQVLSVSPEWLSGQDRAPTHIPAAQAPTGLARAAAGGRSVSDDNSKNSAVSHPLAVTSATPRATPPAVALDPRWPPCPGVAALERGALSEADYRTKLNELRATTNRMLHTSGLPAAQWRQWRELEKHILERFRTVA